MAGKSYKPPLPLSYSLSSQPQCFKFHIITNQQMKPSNIFNLHLHSSYQVVRSQRLSNPLPSAYRLANKNSNAIFISDSPIFIHFLLSSLQYQHHHTLHSHPKSSSTPSTTLYLTSANKQFTFYYSFSLQFSY